MVRVVCPEAQCGAIYPCYKAGEARVSDGSSQTCQTRCELVNSLGQLLTPLPIGEKVKGDGEVGGRSEAWGTLAGRYCYMADILLSHNIMYRVWERAEEGSEECDRGTKVTQILVHAFLSSIVVLDHPTFQN